MTAIAAPELLHATAIAINGQGVLLMGPSGSGKSDLALRLIDRGAVLISDDVVLVETARPLPILRTAPNIAGMIEVHGVGILKVPFADQVPLHLAIELGRAVDRMPSDAQTMEIGGVSVRSISIFGLEASAPLKVEQALRL